jgi:hypothetical protein
MHKPISHLPKIPKMPKISKISQTFLLSGALLMAVAPARVAAQDFDTSGTASLSGQYLFRYVDFFNDSNGDLTESCSLTGVIAFNGAGNYTLSNTQLFDSAGGSGAGTCASLGGGTYGVQSNGIAQLDNPLYAATLLAPSANPWSSPARRRTTTSISLSRCRPQRALFRTAVCRVPSPWAPWISSMLASSPNNLARQGYFTLNADGNGNIAAFTVTGSAANLSSGNNHPERCRLHLCSLRRGRWNLDLSRHLRRSDADRQPARRPCMSRQMGTGSWEGRQPDLT